MGKPRASRMPSQTFDLPGFVDAWNSQDPDALVAFYAPEARVTRSSIPLPWEGTEAIRHGFANFLSAWDNLKVTPRNAIGEENRAAVVLSYAGDHAHEAELAPGARLSPSGRRVAWDIAHLLAVDSQGKIVRDEGIFDMLSFLGQLGASPDLLSSVALRETKPPLPSRGLA